MTKKTEKFRYQVKKLPGEIVPEKSHHKVSGNNCDLPCEVNIYMYKINICGHLVLVFIVFHKLKECLKYI